MTSQPTVAADASPPPKLDYEDAPLRPLHIQVAVGSTGGVFSDGFVLGIIGISISLATPRLGLTPLWLGLLGAASLAGLFAGALAMGPIADRIGRRPIFAYNMAVFALISGLQFFVASAVQLLALRLLLGLVLGADYVLSKAMVAEFTPRRRRGALGSLLGVAWAGGYVCAYVVGFLLMGKGPDAWRWMLATSALPALIILPVRLGIPESPLWLADHGRARDAERIVAERIGADVAAPPPGASRPHQGAWSALFSAQQRRRTLISFAFYTCQTIPYFALGTFVPKVMQALNVRSGYVGGLAYNLFLFAGAVLGLSIVDRIGRRPFLAGSFAITAAALTVLCLGDHLPAAAVVLLFSLFAGALAASTSLDYVYMPELFPTDLRGSGIGLTVAISRIGAAVSTFGLPMFVAAFGARPALAACIAVLAFGGVVCQLWAPETRRARLAAIEQSSTA